MPRRTWQPLAFVLLAASIALRADPPKSSDRDNSKEARPYEAQVLVIRATQRNEAISPELKSIAAALKKDFKFTGFTLEKRVETTVADRQRRAVNLVGDLKLWIEPRERKGEQITVDLEIVRVEPADGGEDSPRSKGKDKPGKTDKGGKNDRRKDGEKAGATDPDEGDKTREKRILKTSLTLEAGKTQLIGGPDLDHNDKLIVAVSVR